MDILICCSCHKSHIGLHESSYLSTIFIYDSDTESGYKLIDCPVIYDSSG